MKVTITKEIIEAGEYKNNLDITEVILESAVRVISEEAFYGCTNLTIINFPEHLEVIGDRAFKGCKTLTITQKYSTSSYTSNIEYIGNEAFYGVSLQGILTGGYNLIHIGEGAFKEASNTHGMYFNYLKSIGRYAFYEFNKSLNYLGGDINIISSNLIDIQDYAFYNSKIYLDFSNIGELTIGNYAFAYCDIGTIFRCSNVVSIGEYAFYKSPDLEYVNLGTKIKELGEYAFSECYKLKKVYIPSSILVLNVGVFRDSSHWQGDYDGETPTFIFGTHVEPPVLEWASLPYQTYDKCIIIIPSEIKSECLSKWDELWYELYGCSVLDDYNIYSLEECELFRFNIGDKTFLAENNMTWGDWILSEYCNYRIQGNTPIVYEGSREFGLFEITEYSNIRYPSKDSVILVRDYKNNNTPVRSTDIISPNLIYFI